MLLIQTCSFLLLLQGLASADRAPPDPPWEVTSAGTPDEYAFRNIIRRPQLDVYNHWHQYGPLIESDRDTLNRTKCYCRPTDPQDAASGIWAHWYVADFYMSKYNHVMHLENICSRNNEYKPNEMGGVKVTKSCMPLASAVIEGDNYEDNFAWDGHFLRWVTVPNLLHFMWSKRAEHRDQFTWGDVEQRFLGMKTHNKGKGQPLGSLFEVETACDIICRQKFGNFTVVREGDWPFAVGEEWRSQYEAFLPSNVCRVDRLIKQCHLHDEEYNGKNS